MSEASRARFLSSGEFKQMQDAASDCAAAQAKAQDILLAARAEADRILSEAQDKADAMVADLVEASDAGLEKFLNEAAIDKTADALAKLLEHCTRIQADFDGARTWLLPIVETALQRIIADMPDKEVLRGTLTQSMAEVRARWDLTVCCNGAFLPLISEVLREEPQLAQIIREVQVDHSLSKGEVRIISAQGVFDISIDTQINAFVRGLEAFLEAQPAGPGAQATGWE